MALINNIFPNPLSIRSSQSDSSKSDALLATRKELLGKKKISLAQAIKNQLNSHRNGQRSTDDPDTLEIQKLAGLAQNVRLLLLRECDVRGRRLLFDSANGLNAENDLLLQDLQLIKDMAFGSATLKHFGDNYRIHDFGPILWRGYHTMLTKVFLAPSPPQSSDVDPKSAVGTDSGFGELDGSSTIYGSGGSSISSLTTGTSFSSSRTSLSFNSLAMPRIGSTRKVVCHSVMSKAVSPLQNPTCRGSRVRLALVILFSLDDTNRDTNNDNNTTNVTCDTAQSLPIKEVMLENFGLIEHFMQRLQLGVLRAISSRIHFGTLMHEAVDQFGRDLANLRCSYNETPAYSILIEAPGPLTSKLVANRFMTQWESIVSETDTKLTHFFWSTLLSTVLTYHVNWLHSFVRGQKEYFDCGTRVLVLSKNKSLAGRLLHVLSYFIRHASLPTVPFKTNLPMTNLVNPSSGPGRMIRNYLSGASAVNSNADVGSVSANILSLAHDCPVSKNSSSSNILESECSSWNTKNESDRRSSSQQLGNARYLRSYYDVRFQLSPGSSAHRDLQPTTFADVKFAIAKNGFQDFNSFRDTSPVEVMVSASSASEDEPPTPTSASTSYPLRNTPAFFVGSPPDESAHDQASSTRSTLAGYTEPIVVPIPSVPTVEPEITRASYLSRWVYGDCLKSHYQAGRVLQSCDPSTCDWLNELQRDLRAAVAQVQSVSCVVANTDTWQVQVLTCVQEERLREFWVPVAMSGQVAALVESTQLLWLLQHDPQQCLEHIDDQLRLLCRKSEDLGTLLSTSIRCWNVDRVNRLLSIEAQDLPLLMAGCSVHSPSVAQMGGITIS